MTDHARELAVTFGLRSPARTDIPFMIEVAANAVWPTDKGVVITAGVIDALRQAKILPLDYWRINSAFTIAQ